jgi:tripartite-type tricarboxylate transporter receptor subunit TctC
MFFLTPPTALPLIRNGKVKGLAVTSLQRLAIAPEIPTMAESGFAGFDITVWYGLMAPIRTPKAVIDRLYQATAKALAAADTRKGAALGEARQRHRHPNRLKGRSPA